MSFQDVGRTTKRQPNRGGFGSAPSSGNRADISGGSGSSGYEQLSDLIVQFQVRRFCRLLCLSLNCGCVVAMKKCNQYSLIGLIDKVSIELQFPFREMSACWKKWQEA
jgi:hypothetical protein